MSRDKAETIAYAVRKECQKDSLYDWCETWDISIDEFEEFLTNGIKAGEQVKQMNNGWIPCSERLPGTDSYILLSFSNFSIPAVGRYEADKDGGGAFYVGDESETCLSQDLFVNAWQQLPKPYKESE